MTGDRRVDAIESFPGHAWAWSSRLPLYAVHGRQHARRLRIYDDRVELHRGRHQVVVVDLAELGGFEFEPAVLPRWLHGAELRVRYDDGTYAPAVMVPVAPRTLESWLRDQGWPVTTRDSPPPGREIRAVPPNEDGRTEPGSVFRPPGTSTVAAVLWTLLVAALVAGFVGALVYGVSQDVGSRPLESGSGRTGAELALP